MLRSALDSPAPFVVAHRAGNDSARCAPPKRCGCRSSRRTSTVRGATRGPAPQDTRALPDPLGSLAARARRGGRDSWSTSARRTAPEPSSCSISRATTAGWGARSPTPPRCRRGGPRHGVLTHWRLLEALKHRSAPGSCTRSAAADSSECYEHRDLLDPTRRVSVHRRLLDRDAVTELRRRDGTHDVMAGGDAEQARMLGDWGVQGVIVRRFEALRRPVRAGAPAVTLSLGELLAAAASVGDGW